MIHLNDVISVNYKEYPEKQKAFRVKSIVHPEKKKAIIF